MNFSDQKPIYIQISDTIVEKILRDRWQADERIPSVREFGAYLGVNPNTVARAYDYLQRENIIYNKRGIGYFVSPEAKTKILGDMKKAFLKEDLNDFFHKMELLDISMEDIITRFEKFKHSF